MGNLRPPLVTGDNAFLGVCIKTIHESLYNPKRKPPVDKRLEVYILRSGPILRTKCEYIPQIPVARLFGALPYFAEQPFPRPAPIIDDGPINKPETFGFFVSEKPNNVGFVLINKSQYQKAVTSIYRRYIYAKMKTTGNEGDLPNKYSDIRGDIGENYRRYNLNAPGGFVISVKGLSEAIIYLKENGGFNEEEKSLIHFLCSQKILNAYNYFPISKFADAKYSYDTVTVDQIVFAEVDRDYEYVTHAYLLASLIAAHYKVDEDPQNFFKALGFDEKFIQNAARLHEKVEDIPHSRKNTGYTHFEGACNKDDDGRTCLRQIAHHIIWVMVVDFSRAMERVRGMDHELTGRAYFFPRDPVWVSNEGENTYYRCVPRDRNRHREATSFTDIIRWQSHCGDNPDFDEQTKCEYEHRRKLSEIAKHYFEAISDKTKIVLQEMQKVYGIGNDNLYQKY